MIQLVIILYVGLYALWLQRGYQEFANVESSVTIKIKGVTKSVLDEHSTENEGKAFLLALQQFWLNLWQLLYLSLL